MVKEDIIKSALDLFLVRRSCKNVTMDEIASELGISKRTLYEHFDNKEKLVLECMNFRTDDICQKCEHIKANAKHAFDYFFNSVRIIQSSLKELVILTDEIRKVYPEIFKQIVSSHVVFARTSNDYFFDKAKQDGFIRDDVDQKFFVGMMEMNMLNASNPCFFDKNMSYEDENLKIKIFYTILRGISSVKGIEYIDNVIKNQ